MNAVTPIAIPPCIPAGRGAPTGGIQPDQVWAEMRERSGRCGIAEKLPKPPGRVPAHP